MTFASQTALTLACCLIGFGCGELGGRAAVMAGAHYLSNKATLAYVTSAVAGMVATLATVVYHTTFA